MNATTTASPQRRTRIRYLVIAFIFLITTINYADRATFSMAGSAASAELGINAVEMGFILSAFAWSYTIGQIPGGALLDKFGTRIIYASAIATWSLFTLLQGFVGLIAGLPVVASLFAMRFLVGVAEAPSFPGNARIAARQGVIVRHAQVDAAGLSVAASEGPALVRERGAVVVGR